MNSLLYTIFISLAIKMTFLASFILIIKKLLNKKLTALMHCSIWMILLIQFLFCILNVNISAPTSIYNYVSINESSAVTAMKTVSNSMSVKDIVTLVWLMGSISLMTWYVSVFFSFKTRLKSFEIIKDDNTRITLYKLMEKLKIDSDEKITLRYGEIAQTMPHVIILPRDYTDDEIYQVMIHELCHYKHGDYMKIWIAVGVLCLNWFNPIAWIAFRKFRTDIEMLCDDRALSATNTKQGYAEILVKSGTMKNHFVPGIVGVHNGKNEIILRVKRIVSKRTIAIPWRILGICVCFTIGCLFLTDQATKAVENTALPVVDLTATPEPIMPKITKAPTPEPTAATVVPTKTPKKPKATAGQKAVKTQTPTKSRAVIENASTEMPQKTAAPASTPTVQPKDEKPSELDVSIGSTRDEVYSSLGEPENVSGNGTKETYELEDGTTAVLQYDGDTLESGYIIRN